MLTGLDRVMLAADDLESAIDHYARLLGCAPSWRGTAAEGEVESAIFRFANGALQIVSPIGGGAKGPVSDAVGETAKGPVSDAAGETAKGPVSGALQRFVRARGEGLYGLIFATDDAHATGDALRAGGVPVGEPLRGMGIGSAGFPQLEWLNVVLPPTVGRGVLILAGEAPLEAPALSQPQAEANENEVAIGIDHVVVHCADAEASSFVYRDQLGIRLALDREFPERGLRLVFFRLGGVTVELVQSLTSKTGSSRPDRLGGLAWKVRDVRAIRRRLERQGFEVSEDRPGFKPGTRVCTVQSHTHGVPTLLIDSEG